MKHWICPNCKVGYQKGQGLVNIAPPYSMWEDPEDDKLVFCRNCDEYWSMSEIMEDVDINQATKTHQECLGLIDHYQDEMSRKEDELVTLQLELDAIKLKLKSDPNAEDLLKDILVTIHMNMLHFFDDKRDMTDREKTVVMVQIDRLSEKILGTRLFFKE